MIVGTGLNNSATCKKHVNRARRKLSPTRKNEKQITDFSPESDRFFRTFTSEKNLEISTSGHIDSK